MTTPDSGAYGTHAGLSVYGNTTNHNELNIAGGSHLYALAGSTSAQRGGSDFNTLNLLTGGSVTNGYAGYTEGTTASAHDLANDPAAKADAKNNTVNIKGGTLNAGGKIYGGYIATNTALSATSTGDASGNTINIENGTFGGSTEIYGGFTNGTGKATGNTVNLGKSDGTFNAPTLSNVMLYGGGSSGSASDVVTGNTLNVNANATVRNIANFSKVSFNFTPAFNQANPMLNLTGGAATSLDWNGITYKGTMPTGRTILMQNMSNINLTGYTGARLISLTDTHERVLDTNTGTETAQQILLDGYQFKDANITPTTGSATADVWAGRSVIGNTTTENTLTINGTTHRDAYGGWTAGTGTTKAAKDNSTSNTVNLQAGTLRHIYGGFTSAAGGKATDNKVNISGGAVTGTVHGGYLSHAAATGDATGNRVTITGGTMGDVYGGFTSGTGKTTGNIVNLGDGSHALAAGTTINGVLYGGNKADAADNTLNVNANAAAGNIAKFDKIKFNLNSTINAANSVLRLTNGSQTTGVNWTKMEVDTSSLTGAGIKSYEPYRLKLMDNAAGIATTGYTGARDRSTDKLEYIIDTDNHTANAAQYITLEGYQFKDNTAAAYTATDGSHPEAWAGRTRVGHKVENNKLTVTGGSLTTAAYGGLVENNKLDAHGNPLPTGDAEKNTVAVTGGTVANAYGAEVRTKEGNATQNTAEISGGTIGSAYGASLTAANAAGSVTKSKVNISGTANITGNVYGGHIDKATATGSVTDSEVSVKGGSVGGSIYGSHNSGSGDAKNGTVTITGGTMGDVYGGFANGTGKTTGNIVNLGTASDAVAGTTHITGTIYGGNKTDDVTGNTLNVYDSVSAGNIANFDKINFKATSSHVTAGDTILTLNGGSATNLDWNKLHVDNLDSVTASATEDHILTLMENANNINFGTSYSKTGTRGRIHTNDYEADIATEGNTATTKKVYLKGYRFQNNTTNYAGGAATEAWGGRSIIGNKVQNNTLTLTGGSATLNARGGMVENTERDAHGNVKTTGDAAANKIFVNTGAQTANAYGAEVKTKAGSATENEATLAGGTVHGNLYGATLTAADATGSIEKSIVNIKSGSIGGAVYGGHIADGAATGSVTGNTVTVTGGTVAGDIYGGFTSGTGKTTGNTVNLGDGSHALAAGTAINGVLYGGNKADAADNTLNVNTNATVGNIANFDKVKLNLNSSVNTANSLLTLNNGTQTTGLRWDKLEVNTGSLTGAGTKSYEPYKLKLMDNAAGIATVGYTGARDSSTDKLEYIIDTDNHTATANRYITLEGYQFKDNTAASYGAADGSHAEAWAGRTRVGNKVLNNKLTVTGGSLTTAAYGGLVENNKLDAHGNPLPTGDAEKNTVTVTGGTVANAYGAEVRTKEGNATQNTAEITGGTVGSVYGASLTAAGAAGTVDKGKVNISGTAHITGDVCGGQIDKATATGSIKNSDVSITGGTVDGSIYGGRNQGTGSATGGTLNITGGTLHAVYGNHTNAGDATGAAINITGGTVGDVYGGFTHGAGKTTGNTVNLGTADNAVAAGTTVGTITGGNKADVAGNTLNINSRNANAADVKNFENVNFDAAHNVSQGDTMLTLSGGANTVIDWAKLKLKNLDAITASPTESRILTLLNSANDIHFTNYDAARARRTKTDGDYEYVLNTDTETATAKKVNVTGYRFANNKPVYSTGTNTEAWGGRSKVGNKVEKNELSVTGGTLTKAAYGGIVQNLEAGDGVDGYKTNGDAAKNKLILKTGATIADGYGADVRTQKGSATGNIIDLKGATVTGNLYGGALTHNAASGAATGNEINLLSGTVTGDVYGGFVKHAAASGTTKNNKITIGDGTSDAGVTVTGSLVGGSKTAEGNVLAIKSKGASVGSLKNFGKITFDLGASVANHSTVLTLTQDTTIDYSTIEKPTGANVSAWLGNEMEKSVHLFQMAAGKKLTLSGYTPATGSERTGDVEYSLVTDNNASVTTGNAAGTQGRLDLAAYKWQNADVVITSGAAANVFGGKTLYKTDGKTVNNKLTLKAGAAVTNAIAGDTRTDSGTAEHNTLTVEAGTAANAYGAKTKAGKAVSNKAIAADGNVTNLVGAESMTGTVEENTAEVKGGSVANAIGGKAKGDVSTNHAIISGGSITGSLVGAESTNAKAVKNNVLIKGGTISGAKIMGAQAKDSAEENSVSITTTPTSNAATEITGGHSTHGNAIKNTVDVGAAVTGNIIGGSTDDTTGKDAIENVVNVGANVTGNIYGGRAHNASVRNTVNIKDGVTVTGSVYGGSCITAEGNVVNIGKGSTVTGDVIAGNATGRNDNNIINLTGSTVGGTIKGGNGGVNDHNNTLAIHHDLTKPTSNVHDFTGIQRLHFYLNEAVENENPTLLKLGVTSKDIRNIDIGLGVRGTARTLKVNDVVSLMKVAGNGNLTMNSPTENKITGMHGISLLYEFTLKKRGTDELIATVSKAAFNDKAKSFAETRGAGTSVINGGADLLAGPGIGAATDETDERGYHLWAAMQQGGMKIKTGSYADTKGYSLAVGWTRQLHGKDKTTLTFSPFVEYGKSKYDSYLDDGTHGSGNISYLGVGVMGRAENAKGLWAEAALHGGSARSDYSGSVYTGSASHYSGANKYYAAHLGLGKEVKTTDKDKMNVYLRYFWSYQSGMQTDIHTDGSSSSVDTYDFRAVHSNRVRLGFTYTHRDSDKSEIFAGLAWEYELSGKVGASFQGYEAPSPSLRGASGMLEVGYRFAPKDSRFSYDLYLTGWQGKRQGCTGGAHVNWAF